MKNIEKRKSIFNILNKYYNSEAIDYGDYFLAVICFSIKINKLNDFSKIKNNSFEEINNFLKKEKIMKNVKICEIGGNDLLKLRQYGAEVKTNNRLINLKCQNFQENYEYTQKPRGFLTNYKDSFNKKFDLTASSYFFSSCNFIKIKENEIYDPKNQIKNTIELLSVFSLLTKKNCCSIHKGADLLNNKEINKILNYLNFEKICEMRDIVVLEKV